MNIPVEIAQLILNQLPITHELHIHPCCHDRKIYTTGAYFDGLGLKVAVFMFSFDGSDIHEPHGIFLTRCMRGTFMRLERSDLSEMSRLVFLFVDDWCEDMDEATSGLTQLVWNATLREIHSFIEIYFRVGYVPGNLS